MRLKQKGRERLWQRDKLSLSVQGVREVEEETKMHGEEEGKGRDKGDWMLLGRKWPELTTGSPSPIKVPSGTGLHFTLQTHVWTRSPPSATGKACGAPSPMLYDIYNRSRSIPREPEPIIYCMIPYWTHLLLRLVCLGSINLPSMTLSNGSIKGVKPWL